MSSVSATQVTLRSSSIGFRCRDNASLLKHYNLTVTLANGLSMLYATDLGISDCTQWCWLVTMVYMSGVAMVYPTIQTVESRIVIYLRTGPQTKAPDGTYQVNLLGVKI